MRKLATYRKLFEKQSGPEGCGVACLSMILNYSGRYSEACSLKYKARVSDKGLSLYDLNLLAAEYQLKSRCVRMELKTLQELDRPCILHALNVLGETHFIVYFAALVKNNGFHYFIGDPAIGVSLISESELNERWPGNAALYFETLTVAAEQKDSHPWRSLTKINAFRKSLVVSVLFLNIGSLLLGIALSWMLQLGMNDSPAGHKPRLVIAVVSLLFIITLFKNVVTFVRQLLLIALNHEAGIEIYTAFTKRIFAENSDAFEPKEMVKKGLHDNQKIQNALAALVSVWLSEGMIITLIIGGLWYFEPIAGMINTLYIGLSGYWAFKSAPLIHNQAAYIQVLSANTEKKLVIELKERLGSTTENNEPKKLLEVHKRFQSEAKVLALRISKINLRQESVGTVSVMLVFVLCLVEIQQGSISYGALMITVILSYFITSLLPKVYNIIGVISEGAQLMRQYL